MARVSVKKGPGSGTGVRPLSTVYSVTNHEFTNTLALNKSSYATNVCIKKTEANFKLYIKKAKINYDSRCLIGAILSVR